FSLRTLCCSGTRLIFLNLQVSQFQFVSADAFGGDLMTLRALEVVRSNREIAIAFSTVMESRTRFNFQFHVSQSSVARKSSETEAQGIFINGCKFSNAHSHFCVLHIRMELQFGAHRLQNRIGDAHFVHSQQIRGNWSPGSRST